MTFAFVLSQIFTVIMYGFLFASYLVKKRRNLLILNILGVFFNALAYILLGAWTGLAMCGIVFFRNFYSFWDDTHSKGSTKITKRDVVVLCITYAAIIAVTIPTYNGFWSLMSVFGTSLYNYSIWQKNTLVYKALGVPVGILWIIYNAFVGSVFGVILESALLVASAWGFIKAVKANKNGRKQRHA